MKTAAISRNSGIDARARKLDASTSRTTHRTKGTFTGSTCIRAGQRASDSPGGLTGSGPTLPLALGHCACITLGLPTQQVPLCPGELLSPNLDRFEQARIAQYSSRCFFARFLYSWRVQRLSQGHEGACRQVIAPLQPALFAQLQLTRRPQADEAEGKLALLRLSILAAPSSVLVGPLVDTALSSIAFSSSVSGVPGNAARRNSLRTQACRLHAQHSQKRGLAFGVRPATKPELLLFLDDLHYYDTTLKSLLTVVLADLVNLAQLRIEDLVCQTQHHRIRRDVTHEKLEANNASRFQVCLVLWAIRALPALTTGVYTTDVSTWICDCGQQMYLAAEFQSPDPDMEFDPMEADPMEADTLKARGSRVIARIRLSTPDWVRELICPNCTVTQSWQAILAKDANPQKTILGHSSQRSPTSSSICVSSEDNDDREGYAFAKTHATDDGGFAFIPSKTLLSLSTHAYITYAPGLIPASRRRRINDVSPLKGREGEERRLLCRHPVHVRRYLLPPEGS
ncbi:hypothetical protein PENSPDRAFT_716973 [Peniophora sp. CONT]|nr:hypothetical protein PENSPDRAFT_716973 [Peniophora sp. CONT]